MSRSVLETMRRTLPKAFILENVKGFVDLKEGSVFKDYMRRLGQIKDGTDAAYDLHHEILNALDYGIPQSRRRLFIVGIRKRFRSTAFHWPERKACAPSHGPFWMSQNHQSIDLISPRATCRRKTSSPR